MVAALVVGIVRALPRRLRRTAWLVLFFCGVAALVVFSRVYLPRSQSSGHDFYLWVFIGLESVIAFMQVGCLTATATAPHMPGLHDISRDCSAHHCGL